MIRGYARVSTKGQVLGTSLEDQRKALTAAGCQEIYEDVMSGAKMDRPGFDRLKDDLAAGDTVVVTAFDRFARTVGEAYIQVEEWFKKGVRVWILNLGVIEDTEMGRILMGIMLVFADFERRTIIRRLQGGRAYKRANDPGYRDGRKPKFTEAQLDLAVELLENHSYTEVTDLTGISRSTLTRAARARGFNKESPFLSGNV